MTGVILHEEPPSEERLKEARDKKERELLIHNSLEVISELAKLVQHIQTGSCSASCVIGDKGYPKFKENLEALAKYAIG